jgi:hypothetical protein
MTDIIGKTLDEIRGLDPDVDELSDREVCYIVALGMGDVSDKGDICKFEGSPFWDNKGGEFAPSKIREVFVWPDYTSSWKHAGRVLGAMPAGTETATYSSDSARGAICCYEKRSTDVWNTSRLDKRFKADEDTLKESITKAAAKCVLEGI